MSQNSAIEWTEATWNPVRGCVKVSPGCAHCYAETFAERWRGIPGHAYEQGFDLRLVPEKLNEPRRIKKPTTFFVNSMSDLFQEGVPSAHIDAVFATMRDCPQHTFQVLTKRAERMRDYMNGLGWLEPLPNVWLGVSVENQRWLERIDSLKDTPAAVRFVSFEPLLEDVGALVLDGIQWCIVGGESGPGARPFHISWARSIVAECKRQNVAVFVKQLGSRAMDYFDHHEWPSGTRAHVGATMQDLNWIQLTKKGGDMPEWPEDLRVREMPAQQTTVIEG